jgi:hypothetical protein
MSEFVVRDNLGSRGALAFRSRTGALLEGTEAALTAVADLATKARV